MNQGREPPRLHGVCTTRTGYSSSFQSSPLLRWRYVRNTRFGSARILPRCTHYRETFDHVSGVVVKLTTPVDVALESPET